MAERTSTLTAGGHKSICVYDGQLNLLARLESWVSLVWPERYNVYSGVQGAQLELHASTDLQALCRPDRYLWLTGSDRIMRICSAQADSSEHKLVISAKDAACILDERISTQTLSGFAVESTLRSLVSGAAAWPGLELGVLADLADAYTGEVKPGSLLSIAEQVCQELDIGFRVRFDQQAKKLLFELYRPKLDPNARYAPQYGNLTGLTYTESITDYKNIVTVAGTAPSPWVPPATPALPGGNCIWTPPAKRRRTARRRRNIWPPCGRWASRNSPSTPASKTSASRQRAASRWARWWPPASPAPTSRQRPALPV